MNSFGTKFYEKEWFGPVAASLVFHTALILLAFFIHFGALAEKKDENVMEFHLNKVRTGGTTLSGKPGGGGLGRLGKGMQVTHFSSPSALEELKNLNRKQIRPLDETISGQNDHEEVPMQTDLKPIASSSKNLDSIIFENEKEGATKKLQVKQRSLNDFYQKDAEKSVKTVALTGEGLLRSLSKSLGGIQLYSPQNMALDPEEGMPGFTPSHGGGSGSGFGDGTGEGPGGPGVGEGVDEGGSGPAKYEPLDNFMDVQVYSYEDPADHQKYFMMKIYAKPGAEALKVMPKEIIFTIDCSLSISKDRLDEFKRGIVYCLTHLNHGDLFNIVAFKDKVIFFAPQSIPANQDSVARAEKFVEDLTASQATDVYKAFSEIIKKPLARKPSDIVLISDGRPTYGVVNSRELINSVTRLNGRVRPVFAFTGGAKVNRYLLDFLAYQNRAWSQFVKRSGQIHGGLAEFYDKIRNPVFLNLRYRLNNLNSGEVFPKSLPDFYRNAEFTLYGKYTNENEFSMQLLGDIDGKTKELIFTRALSKAEKGNEDIKRGYAFNKIYYLISRMTTEGETPALRAQIDSLSRQYGIQTPYSSEKDRSD